MSALQHVQARRAARIPALLVASAGSVLALAALPHAAGAAGFGQPKALTPVHGQVDSPSVAVAPNGRTAVLYRTFGDRSRDFTYRVSIGASPEALPKPVHVAGADRAAGDVGDATLGARPDGGFVACFADDPRKGDQTLGCAIAGPSGGLGRLHRITRGSWKLRLQYASAVRADGATVLLLSRNRGGGKAALSSVLMAPDGTVGPERPLGTVLRDAPSLAALDDGSVATVLPPADEQGAAQLRILRPGGDAFGPAVPLPAGADGAGLSISGGRGLILQIQPRDSYDAADARVARRLPDGTWSTPAPFATLPKGAGVGAPLLLPGGDLLTVAERSRSDLTDCDGLVSGQVGAGPAGGAAAVLSTPGQIAVDPQAAVLDDGTVIVTWFDVVDESGHVRVEVATRTPGAAKFSRGHALPVLATRDFDTAFAAGGNTAAIVWSAGSAPDGPSHLVVSAYRTAPPYAKTGKRPAHPVAPCS